MDINRIIVELRSERDRLDGIITALERLQTEDCKLGAPKRRGRKFMDKSARREVSERMKRYWAERRKANAGGAGAPKQSSQNASGAMVGTAAA